MMTPYVRIMEAKPPAKKPDTKSTKKDAGKKKDQKKKKVDIAPVLYPLLNSISYNDHDKYDETLQELNGIMKAMVSSIAGNNDIKGASTPEQAVSELGSWIQNRFSKSKYPRIRKDFNNKKVIARLAQVSWFLYQKGGLVPNLFSKKDEWVKAAETAYLESIQDTNSDQEDEDANVALDFGGVPETKTNTIRFKYLSEIQKEQLLDLLNIKKKYGYFPGKGINVKKMLKMEDPIATMGVDVYYVYEESGKKYTITLYPGKGITTGWLGNRKLLSRLKTKFDPKLWKSAQKFFQSLKNWFSSGVAGRDAGHSELHMTVAYADKQKPNEFFQQLVDIVNDEFPETPEALQRHGVVPQAQQQQQPEPASNPPPAAPAPVKMPSAQKESFWRAILAEADEGLDNVDKPRPDAAAGQSAPAAAAPVPPSPPNPPTPPGNPPTESGEKVRPVSQHPGKVGKITLPNVEMVVETVKNKLFKARG